VADPSLAFPARDQSATAVIELDMFTALRGQTTGLYGIRNHKIKYTHSIQCSCGLTGTK